MAGKEPWRDSHSTTQFEFDISGKVNAQRMERRYHLQTREAKSYACSSHVS